MRLVEGGPRRKKASRPRSWRSHEAVREFGEASGRDQLGNAGAPAGDLFRRGMRLAAGSTREGRAGLAAMMRAVVATLALLVATAEARLVELVDFESGLSATRTVHAGYAARQVAAVAVNETSDVSPSDEESDWDAPGEDPSDSGTRLVALASASVVAAIALGV